MITEFKIIAQVNEIWDYVDPPIDKVIFDCKIMTYDEWREQQPKELFYKVHVKEDEENNTLIIHSLRQDNDE